MNSDTRLYAQVFDASKWDIETTNETEAMNNEYKKTKPEIKRVYLTRPETPAAMKVLRYPTTYSFVIDSQRKDQ